MTLPRFITAILLTGFAFALPLGATQNKHPNRDAFAEVPAHLRTRLIERLNLLVGYQRTKQWGKMCDLLDEQYKMAVDGGLTREKFIESRKLTSRLSKFTPHNITTMTNAEKDGWWVIWGCGEYSKFGPNEI